MDETEGCLLYTSVHAGVPNIICTQPFGCLPNHIVGKGMIRKIRVRYPQANIVAIDYDPGATRINQENRIKLMLAVAREAAEVHPVGEQDAVHFKRRAASPAKEVETPTAL